MPSLRFLRGTPFGSAISRLADITNTRLNARADGTYKVINHSDYAGGSDNIYYTQRNEGKFVIVESRAPSGYYGDWTDVTKPGTAGSVLGKRAYAFEITKALDCLDDLAGERRL